MASVVYVKNETNWVYYSSTRDFNERYPWQWKVHVTSHHRYWFQSSVRSDIALKRMVRQVLLLADISGR